MDKSVTSSTTIYYTKKTASLFLLSPTRSLHNLYNVLFTHWRNKEFHKQLVKKLCRIRKNKESYLKISNATSFVCFWVKCFFISVVVSFPYNIENEIHLILQNSKTDMNSSYVFFHISSRARLFWRLMSLGPPQKMFISFHLCLLFFFLPTFGYSFYNNTTNYLWRCTRCDYTRCLVFLDKHKHCKWARGFPAVCFVLHQSFEM